MKIHPIKPLAFVGSVAKRLYLLEERRNAAIQEAAKELAFVLNHEKHEYWSATMPQALANVLESYERPCGIAAALIYLHQYGTVKFTPDCEETITITQQRKEP